MIEREQVTRRRNADFEHPRSVADRRYQALRCRRFLQ
jgi:hypothetical protein